MGGVETFWTWSDTLHDELFPTTPSKEWFSFTIPIVWVIAADLINIPCHCIATKGAAEGLKNNMIVEFKLLLIKNIRLSS